MASGEWSAQVTEIIVSRVPVAVPCGCCCVLQARFFIPASDTRQS